MSKVYLVGAGPGDARLITCRGRELLESAACVLYDHLANPSLLDLAPRDAERIYVGKKRALHAHTQEEICAMLIDRARRGGNVVRLKGGDPFIFGRGGEEAEALFDAGIPFEVVPGVTTPLGIAAYTGVPLTHRDHTSVVTFVTGHDVAQIDWERVGGAETLVLFMGLTNFSEIAAEIMRRGRSPETPAMAVRWATLPSQQTLTGTLGTLGDLIRAANLKPPATIVIGDVVRLREKLNWFERLPLFGKRVAVTRARGQADALSSRLSELGAETVGIPTIEILPAEDYAPLDRAIESLPEYDWLVFTSANGVRFFLDRLEKSRFDLRAIRGRICAIGPATGAAIEELHLKVDLTGKEFVAEGLVEAFASHDLAGKRVLLPRAAIARDVLPIALRDRGALVDVVPAYRTGAPEDAAERIRAAFEGPRKPNWITFTSSSTVENFVRAAGADSLAGVKVAAIGPVTAATARKHGIAIDAAADVFTTGGLIDAILQSEA